MSAAPEDRKVLNRFSSGLADIAAVQIEPGSVSHRSTCPDGQFWLPMRGEQVVEGAYGRRRQRPFELFYYAPREPAVRMADSPTLAYGLRVKLSGLTSEERDPTWTEDGQPGWETTRTVIRLIAQGFGGDPDPHAIDETVARWVGHRRRSRPEAPQARWLGQVEALLYDDPSLSLVDLSRAVGVVPAYLSAEFSRLRGQTVSAYRRQVMVQRALSLADRATLNEAAIEAGFYDASHFYRACMAELQVKPSALRRLLCPT